MFSEKAQRLDELRGVLDDRAIEVLRDILGAPFQPLRHDGPLTLGAPRDGEFGPNLLPEDSDFKMRGRPLGTTKWAEATGYSEVRRNSRTGRDATWVTAKAVTNQYGEERTGAAFDLLLAPTEDTPLKIGPGTVIPYGYDIHGTRVSEALAVAGSRTKLRWARAAAGWTWLPGYSGMVGVVTGVEVDDIFGNNPGEDGFEVYLRATSNQDPNVQPGDIIGWMEDEAGQRVAVCGHLDAKIGTIDILAPTIEVPGGWRVYEDLTGYFLVGWGANHPEYNHEGEVFGKHPIRPRAHTSGEPNSASSIWRTDWTGHWYETAWLFNDHGEQETTTEETGISIETTALNTEAVWTVGVTSGIVVLVNPAGTGISIPDHPLHTHSPSEVDEVVDAVGGTLVAGMGETEEAEGHIHEVNVGYTDVVWRFVPSLHEDATLHHPVNEEPHTHTTAPHSHGVRCEPHAHEINPEDHGHGVDDPGHFHKTPKLSHAGAFYHRTEDYRPPCKCVRFKIRVGPEFD